MKKLLSITVLGLLAACAPAQSAAQQTLAEVKDSIQNILSLARQKVPDKQNEVGKWFYIGRHVEQNYEAAAKWWAAAASQNYGPSVGNLARCYQLGHGVTADSTKAANLYIKAFELGQDSLFSRHVELAKKGDVFSAMLVAHCYEKGISPATGGKDAAAPFLEIAANAGNLGATYDLGMYYFAGNHAIKAAPWFRRGSDAGCTKCSYMLGRLYLEGKGVKPDAHQGANLMLKAAESGNADAMLTVANCYFNGNGLTKNPEQGLKWLMRAAGASQTEPLVRPKAQLRIADCYRLGNGTPVNLDEAFNWYAAAANNNLSTNVNRMIADSLAKDDPFILYGRGLKAYTNGRFSEAEAIFKQLNKAMGKSGSSDAAVMLAAIQAAPNNPKSNPQKGFKALQKLAPANPRAAYILAKLYERGDGVDKNMDSAVRYFTQAAAAGYGLAMCALADMYYEGRGVPQDYANAVSWYRAADNLDLLTADAAKRYAECVQNGWGGLEPSKERAKVIRSIKRGPFTTSLLSKF